MRRVQLVLRRSVCVCVCFAFVCMCAPLEINDLSSPPSHGSDVNAVLTLGSLDAYTDDGEFEEFADDGDPSEMVQITKRWAVITL